MLCSLACVLVFANAAFAADETPQVQVQIGESEIFMGESIEYQVVLRNVKTPTPPNMEALAQDFTVTSTGDRSINKHSTFIINGQMRQESEFGHIYAFSLTPKRSGDLTIPGPSVIVDGKTYSGRQLSLRVIPPEKQDLVLVELNCSRSKVYPTQPFDVTLKILVKPLPNDPTRDPLSVLPTPPDIQVNWLKSPDGLQTDDVKEWLSKFITNTGRGFTVNGLTISDEFSFFRQSRAAVFSLYTGRETRNGLDGQPISYFVYELKRSFNGEKAGGYSFGPALVKGSFVDGVSNRRYTTKKLVVAAPAQMVQVREVPSPRPPTFCGGIGNYKVTASASPPTLRVGDPLTLTLEIERGAGAGSLELLSAPDISANQKFAEDFDIIDKAPTGDVRGNSKSFSYGLRPKKAGVSVPALAVTTFDPDSEKYVEISTQPVALTVTPAAQLNAGELIGSVTPSGGGREMKSRAEGVFKNIDDIGELKNQRVNAFNFISASIALVIAFGLFAVMVGTWRSRASDAVYQRRQRARSEADQKIKDARGALGGGKTAEALRAAHAAVTGLIADVRNLSAAGMTAHEASQALTNAGVSEELKKKVIGLLESIEAAQYGSVASQDASAIIDSAAQTLPELHRELDAKK